MVMATIPFVCITTTTNNNKTWKNCIRISNSNSNSNSNSSLTTTSTSRRPNLLEIRAIKQQHSSSSADEITSKYDLELGLWKIFSSMEMEIINLKPRSYCRSLPSNLYHSLLDIFFPLITVGVDVQPFLPKVEISANETGEKWGLFALAYAAHKVASPIRFPPTVALTPIVASWICQKVNKDN